VLCHLMRVGLDDSQHKENPRLVLGFGAVIAVSSMLLHHKNGYKIDQLRANAAVRTQCYLVS